MHGSSKQNSEKRPVKLVFVTPEIMIRKLKNKIINYLFLQIQDLQRKKEQQQLESLKEQFKSFGVGFGLGKDYNILNPQFMQFGENFWASHRFRIEAIDYYENQTFSPKIVIGDNVSMGNDNHIGCIDKIEIGNNCLFGSRIYITDHDHGGTTLDALQLPPEKRKLVSKGPVVIMDNVWIGDGVAILSGVTIGENAIIATNSVVTKDVSANTVVGGIPAKTIKTIE